jgi:hypothetical protein
MKELLSKIIISILEGEDYRPFVLATINKRFVDNAYVLLERVYRAKKKDESIDWWLDNLIDKSTSRNEILWFGGLNAKTVHNMTGTTKREVCIELGKENIRSLGLLIRQFTSGKVPRMLVSIIFGSDRVELNELESLILVNTLAAMKLSIQGGAWSEVGKKTEKQLLYTIFELLSIKPSQYVLVFEEMKKKGLVENREIDSIVFSDDGKKVLQIELKLLGIGNPEIADEALARKVDLFLIDRLTPMMVAEAAKIGVKVIEMRGKGSLDKIGEFFNSHNVSVIRPGKVNFEARVPEILSKYDEELENKKLLKKAKELTK